LSLPKARRDHLIVSDLDDETIIYDKRMHQSTCLYRAAKRVADAVDDLAGRLTGNASLFHAPPHISGED
jgi:hypothetical protein